MFGQGDFFVRENRGGWGLRNKGWTKDVRKKIFPVVRVQGK